MSARVVWRGKDVKSRLTAAAGKAVLAAAVECSDIARAKMGSEGGGVLRKTRKGRNVYYAAPPGAYPGVRTGSLRRSLFAEKRGTMGAIFGVQPRYGRYLEFGYTTRSGGHVPARPWARPTVWQNRERLRRVFVSSMKGSLS